MIIFNGVDIDSVAPVKIENIQVSPAELEPVARQRAIVGGADLVRIREGTRTITVTFAVLVDDPTLREIHLDALREWARLGSVCKLQLGFVPDRYLEAACTGFPEPTVRMWWESKLRLVFTCFDNPYWTSLIQSSAECGTAFFVPGDAPPLMQITRSLSAAAVNQSFSLDSRMMTFSTIPAGEMTIDLNRQTASVGNISIMQYYTFTSRFLIPRPGAQSISGTGQIKYRARWR